MRHLTRYLAAAIALVASIGIDAGSQPRPSQSYIAFRFDDRRAIVVAAVFDDLSARQFHDGLSPAPAARWGFAYVEDAMPPHWRQRVDDNVASTLTWTLHAGPNLRFNATLDRLVAGNAQCRSAVGALLDIPQESQEAFARVKAHYFIATPDAAVAATPSPIGPFTASLSPARRRQLEATLNDLLIRELPGISADSRTGPGDAARQRMDRTLQAGQGRLTYDVQGYRLTAADRLLFVRARWFVGSRLGFEAAAWLREAPSAASLSVVDTDLWAASWLRTRLARGTIYDSNLGLVLNVFDRDGDGWAEVLTAREGYEGVAIRLRRYTSQGFVDDGPAMQQGC
jgi:hypothetical protein